MPKGAPVTRTECLDDITFLLRSKLAQSSRFGRFQLVESKTAESTSATKRAERQNDFGGVLGGPVRKDNTFFFFSYEGLRLRQPATQQSVVPDSASRQQVPAATQPYLNAFPIANGTGLGPGIAQIQRRLFESFSLDAASLRVDHFVNSNLTIFGRYNYSPSSLDQQAPQLAGPVLSMTEALSSRVQTGTAGVTGLITPGMSNELRANYSNDRLGTKYCLDNFGGAVPLPDSMLFPSGYSSANAERSARVALLSPIAPAESNRSLRNWR